MPSFRKAISQAITVTNATSSGNTGVTTQGEPFDDVLLACSITSITGTSPTVTLTLEYSPDGGVSWFPLNGITGDTGALSATGNYTIEKLAPIGTRLRIVYTTGGTVTDLDMIFYYVFSKRGMK